MQSFPNRPQRSPAVMAGKRSRKPDTQATRVIARNGARP